MLTRSIWLMPLASMALGCMGCGFRSVSFSYYDDDPPPVRVARVHRHVHHTCGYDCHDCYWDGHKVVIIKGHRHGPGCGHVWDGKHWMVVKRSKARPVHRRTVKVHKARPIPPHVHKVTKVKRVP